MRYIFDAAHALALLPPNNPVGVEGVHLEFKRTLDLHPMKSGATYNKIATSLAALANSEGGCLLVGIVERDGTDPGEADSVRSHDTAEISAVVKAIETSVDRTRGFEVRPRAEPFTLVGPTPETTGTILAVNVFPSSRLVSLASPNDPRAILYPVRTGKGNHYLKSEEVEMRMLSRHDANIRGRVIQLLRGAPPEGIRIYLHYLASNGTTATWEAHSHGAVNLKAITSTGALFEFYRPVSSAPARTPVLVEFPFHWISDVWTYLRPDSRSTVVPGTAMFLEAVIAWGGFQGAQTVDAHPYRRP